MYPELQTIEAAVRHFGGSPLAFDVLQRPSRYRFFESHQVPGAWIPYRPIGKVDVIFGDPLLPNASAASVLADFFGTRERDGRQVLGFSESTDSAEFAETSRSQA